MNNNFEADAAREKQLENEFKKLHRQLVKKIHPDQFHKNNGKMGGGKWHEESENLLAEINSLRDYDTYKGEKCSGWETKLDVLKRAEKDVDDFLERIENEASSKAKTENSKTEESGDENIEPDPEKNNKEEKQIEYKKEDEKEKEKIEYQGETTENKQQKIEKLRQEVERSRKEYLDKDYANNKVTMRLHNFFGSFLKKDKKGSGFESDKELAEYRAYYDDALLNYKKGALEEAESKGVSDKELLELAKFFQIEANINLADAHDQVKIENQEGKFSGFIKEHSRELVERYKKMPLAKKIAIGAAFGLAGVGAMYVGGAAVGIAGSAIAARRAIMGVITGTSVSLGFEARGKKKTKENIQKDMEYLEEEMTQLDEIGSSGKETGELAKKEKIKVLEGFINESIYDEDRKIDKIKNKNLRHLAFGVAAGIGVVLAPKIMRLFSEGSIAEGSASEQPGEKSFPAEESKEPERVGMTDEEIAEKLSAEKATPETAVGGAEIIETEPVVVEVQKGDSLWKIIDKQLESQEGYADLNEVQKTYVIDALKDKIAADPESFGLKNIDKLKIGQKIDLSEIFQDKQPENLIAKVQDLSNEQTQNILDNNQKLREWVEANPSEELTSEKTAEILEGESVEPEKLGMTDEKISSVSGASNIEEASKVEGASEVSETSEESKIEGKADIGRQTEENTETREPEIQFESKKSEGIGETLSPEEAHRIIEKSVGKLGENIVSLDYPNFSDGQRVVSWEEIRDVKCSDIRLEAFTVAPEYIKNRLDKIMFFSQEKFGSEGIPKSDEKIKDWLGRLIEKHGEDKIKNIFNLVK